MRVGPDWPWLVAIAICACTAVGIAAYALGLGGMDVTLAGIAFIALAAGLVISQMRDMQRSSTLAALYSEKTRLAAEIASLSRDMREEHRNFGTLTTQIAEVREQSSILQNGIAQDLTELRNSHSNLAQSISTLIENSRYAPPRPVAFTNYAQQPQPEMQQTYEDEPAPAPTEQLQTEIEEEVPFGDALNLSLEPIIDLYTSQTAHYRMVLGMTNERGADVQQDVFTHHADRMGVRDKLDAFVVHEALNILARLRLRDPNLSLMVPVGSATLASPETLQRILRDVSSQPEVAAGLVVEVSHAVLASLPEASLEGLALLARSGVVLSLAQASIAGVDLAALGKLNVKFVGISAASMGLGGKVSAGFGGFVQAARAMRIQIVVSQVGDPAIVAQLARNARFACGPAFAPPRRLRRAEHAPSEIKLGAAA